MVVAIVCMFMMKCIRMSAKKSIIMTSLFTYDMCMHVYVCVCSYEQARYT